MSNDRHWKFVACRSIHKINDVHVEESDEREVGKEAIFRTVDVEKLLNWTDKVYSAHWNGHNYDD